MFPCVWPHSVARPLRWLCSRLSQGPLQILLLQWREPHTLRIEPPHELFSRRKALQELPRESRMQAPQPRKRSGIQRTSEVPTKAVPVGLGPPHVRLVVVPRPGQREGRERERDGVEDARQVRCGVD